VLPLRVLFFHAACREAVLSQWETPAGIVLPLTISAVWYAVGVRASRTRAPRRGIRTREIACFIAGWLTLVIALVSPLHPLGEQLFSAHMVQHTLLMTVAAPLLVLGRPLTPFIWALPASWRRPVGRWASHGPLAPLWRTLTRPGTAWIIQAVVLCGWHMPALYSAVLRSESIHALQHTCFLASALLFWWSVLHMRAARYGTAVISLFTTAMYSGALGALITVAPVAWYPFYAGTAPMWGLTALEDQQLAGLIMWIPGGVSYLIAALVLFVLWLRASDAGMTRAISPGMHQPLVHTTSG
jgi:cytochrome c oxidase assembly factor CtaG